MAKSKLTEDGRKEEPTQHGWEIGTMLMTKSHQSAVPGRIHCRVVAVAFTTASVSNDCCISLCVVNGKNNNKMELKDQTKI
jgi:hypothetical protein